MKLGLKQARGGSDWTGSNRDFCDAARFPEPTGCTCNQYSKTFFAITDGGENLSRILSGI